MTSIVIISTLTLNFHRPRLFPALVTDTKGRERKTYPYKAMMTLL